jgi:uncharacterized protein YutE (UPF0331/DUF86 family)
MDEVVLNQAAVIERGLARIREEHRGDDRTLEDLTRQDSIVLNLQRACEAAIDLAMHLVGRLRLGIPQESREAFALLGEAGALAPELVEPLQRMVGFRNVAVHEYQRLSLPILRAIVAGHLGELERFAEESVKRFG